ADDPVELKGERVAGVALGGEVAVGPEKRKQPQEHNQKEGRDPRPVKRLEHLVYCLGKLDVCPHFSSLHCPNLPTVSVRYSIAHHFMLVNNCFTFILKLFMVHNK